MKLSKFPEAAPLQRARILLGSVAPFRLFRSPPDHCTSFPKNTTTAAWEPSPSCKENAWTASETGKRIQAIAMSIVHNLLRLFEAKLKSEEDIQDTKVIKAWQKDLAKRAEKARAAGRHLPVKLYQALYRPTEVSLQFIRWLRDLLKAWNSSLPL